MAILIRVNGNNSGEGFLIAPDGARTFPVPVGLRTDDGTTVSATLQVAAGGAGVAFSSTAVDITPTETFVDIHATSASSARNDTVLQVLVGAAVQASFNLTAISNPQVWFKGRFEARFATNDDPYNHPTGTTDGWMFKLAGEPDFVPADSVPTTIDKPVGRVVRFHNAVAPRPHVPPIGVSVVAVRGTVGAGEQEFTVGDPVIGLPVNLGPNSYFAGNFPQDPADPPPAETFSDGYQPIGLFEFHIANLFSGESLNATDRPIAGGLVGLTTGPTGELVQYGIGTLSAFNSARKTALLADYNPMTPAQKASQAGVNLATRIGHLGGDPANSIGSLIPSQGFAWNGKEEYTGLINKDVTFQPSNSSVLSYLAGYGSFNFFGKFFNFHTDEACAQVHGSVIADTSSGVAPLQRGVYNIESREAAPFAALTIPQMTEAAINGLLGGAPTAERVVVTVSSDFDRLVVSKAVIANPGDPPASWTITSRGETLVGEFLPEASVLARDLFYRILQAGEQGNVLGVCEGTAFTPAPDVGFARLFADGPVWKLLLHAGTNGADGVTYGGEWAGSTATTPTGCVAPDVELLTPTLDFGNVEQGMTMYRQIVLLNRSAAPVDITLPALAAPFSAPSDVTVTLQPGEVGFLLVAFTAGALGVTPPTIVTLGSNPVVASALDLSLTGTSVAVANVDAVLVLDRSYSMTEPALNAPGRFISKAALRNEAAQVFVDLLRPSDRIGMVRFNHDAQMHMPLQEAGVEMTGAGRVAAAAALASADLNPAGGTSVGDGMFEGNALLTAPSTAAKHALVVLTDGKENTPQYIPDITLGGAVRAYAIGFGQPQGVDVGKLSAVTGNTGGYLLVTGDLDAENEFRLHKYYAQILAGIHGDSIVMDPRGRIDVGEVQRIPFYVSEADSHFDAVLLTRFPVLRFTLEAPDGTRIDPTNAGAFNGMYVNGRACRYYRMRMPIFPGDFTRALGKWHIVVEYPGPKRYRGAFRKVADPQRFDGRKLPLLVANTSRTYNVLVRARSTIQMDTQLEQRGFGPGLDRRVVAFLRAFGQPLTANVNLFAQVTRPDGVVSILPMRHEGDGRYEAALTDSKMLGNYNIVVRASGLTPANFPLQREHTLSGAVIDPAADSTADGKTDEIIGLLKDQQTALQDLAKLFTELLGRLSTPGGPAPSAADALGKWLLWILIVLLLILLLALIALLRS